MREVVIRRRCDTCGEDATRTYVAGVIEGDSVSPAWHTVDTCEDHAAALAALAAELIRLPIWEAPQAPPPRARRQRGGRPGVCDICGQTMKPGSVIAHVWHRHVRQDPPRRPLVCPDCGKVSESPSRAGMHRQSHGHNPLAEAYEAARAAGV